MSQIVTFFTSGRGKAQCPPDNRYPQGIAIPRSGADEHCYVKLPYPAPECGHHRIDCDTCGMSMAITAAGRPDDPVSVYVPCLAVKQ